MDQERLLERIADYLKAVYQLEKAVAQPKNEFMRDSVIRRFKFTHELAWKMLKLRLEKEGVLAKTPREALQKALQAGFIENGNKLSDLQKHRNLTTHTYDEMTAETVYQYACKDALTIFQKTSHPSRTMANQ